MFLFLKPIEGAEIVFPETSQLVSFRNFSFEKGTTQMTPEVLNAYYRSAVEPMIHDNETLYNEVDPRYNELFSLPQ